MRAVTSIALPLLLIAADASVSLPAQTVTPSETKIEKPVVLDPLAVSATADDEEYDATGMGSVEEEMRDEPFANELIQSVDPQMDDLLSADMASEVNAAANTSPAERIAGEERLNLRGFPTPSLRNGFIQVGIPEVLNTARTIVIQGPLIPVLGRAAPGGIQNFMTARPQAKDRQRVDALVSSHDRQRVSAEDTGTLVAKKAWQRVSLEWQRRLGPEDYATEDTRALNTALTWRRNRAFSAMLTADFRQINAVASPGIPEYRTTSAGKIVGPYLPLAQFNANGPEAGVRRRSAIVGLQLDTQPTKALALRASVEGWWRDVEQDRFTTSVLNLDTGYFAGTREPRHSEQPQQALAVQLEATGRYRLLGADHKLLAALSHTWGGLDREERALPTAVRDALPLSVRQFNPAAPNFSRPAYSESLYSRIITDRSEAARYLSAEVSDRLAYARGLWVLTGGLRFDALHLGVEDRKSGALYPHLTNRSTQFSYHAGLNYQIVRNRLLFFASSSSAFDPSTRVDARTGKIQANETTLGHEAGLKGRTKDGKWEANGAAFLLYNRNISRRNPLYDDPVADANQTQPQLVAAGVERFTGTRLDLRWQVAKPFTLALRTVYVRAITTQSIALPQEVGKALARLPALTSSLQARYRSQNPAGGWSFGTGLTHTSNYVARYEDENHAYLEYPATTLVSTSISRAWRLAARSLELELGVRNALNRDLLARNARLGADREFTFSAHLLF